MIWIGSYSAPAFNTANGELGANEYALIDENTFYIRGESLVSENRKIVGYLVITKNLSDIQNKNLVEATGDILYINEFKDENDQMFIDQITYEEFLNTKTTMPVKK